MDQAQQFFHAVHADCGAGVGRVSEQLLLHHCAQVDLIEPSKHLLDTAQHNLTSSGPKPFPAGHRAVHFFNTGLQGWSPEHQRCARLCKMCYPASMPGKRLRASLCSLMFLCRPG